MEPATIEAYSLLDIAPVNLVNTGLDATPSSKTAFRAKFVTPNGIGLEISGAPSSVANCRKLGTAECSNLRIVPANPESS